MSRTRSQRPQEDEKHPAIDAHPLARAPAASDHVSRLAGADAATRATVLLGMQRSAGNAAVGRVIARDPAAKPAAGDPRREAEAAEMQPGGEGTAPHAGGDDKAALELLAQVQALGQGMAAMLPGPMAGILGGVLGAVLGQAQAQAPAGGTATAPSAPGDVQAVTAWKDRKLSTNPEHAQWLLDGEAEGFVKINLKRSREQLQELAKGKKVHQADPSKSEILGGLMISHAMASAKAAEWLADPTKKKVPFEMGSFLRADAHGSGERVDIHGFDWTGSKGPDQVLEALKALPAGRYGIGLPFQGEFFPQDQWFKVHADKAIAEADAAGRTTAAITTPYLMKFKSRRGTGTWDASKRDDKKTGGWTLENKGEAAVKSLKSKTLKDGISALNSSGYDIYVFPDNDAHLHVQKGNG